MRRATMVSNTSPDHILLELEDVSAPHVEVSTIPNSGEGSHLQIPRQRQRTSSIAPTLSSEKDKSSTLLQRGRSPKSPSRIRSGSDYSDHGIDHLTRFSTRFDGRNDPGLSHEHGGDDNGDHFHQRVSFESTPVSLSSTHNAHQALQHLSPSASASSPSQSRSHTPARPPSPHTSPRASSPRRGQSPLRRLWPLNRIYSRTASEDPFIPVDPYRFRFHLFSHHSTAHVPAISFSSTFSQISIQLRHILMQFYLHILLRLPSIYFSRVSRIFQEAEVSRAEMQALVESCAKGIDFPQAQEWGPPVVSPALTRFKDSWEDFIDTVIREWKTLNVVSALLLSAILTMFQISDAATQPIIRTAALISLICASWSLIYGGVYIMRFWTMRSMYKASSWAQEAQRSETSVFFNVWVLLALPAVWLTWSMISFFIAILAFVWTTGSSSDSPANPSQRTELILRIIITAIFCLGILYFYLIVTTFKHYGGVRPKIDLMDLHSSPRLGTIALPPPADAERVDGVERTEQGGRIWGYVGRSVPVGMGAGDTTAIATRPDAAGEIARRGGVNYPPVPPRSPLRPSRVSGEISISGKTEIEKEKEIGASSKDNSKDGSNSISVSVTVSGNGEDEDGQSQSQLQPRTGRYNEAQLNTNALGLSLLQSQL